MNPLRAHLPAAPPVVPVPPALLCYYETGQLAGATGRPVDECPRYRRDRQAAWRRGWHDGRRQWEDRQMPPLTEVQREQGRAQLAALRAKLADLVGTAAPFWSRQYRTDDIAHLWWPDGRSACRVYWWPSHRDRVPIEGFEAGPGAWCVMCGQASGKP